MESVVNQRLWYAVHDERMSDIRRLVEEEGADPAATVVAQSALHWACSRNRFAALRYFVEERNEDVRVMDHVGRTLLHAACRGGDDAHTSFEIVKYLVETGSIDINATETQCKQTPLHVACLCSPARVTRYLVEQGANVNAKDEQNRNGLDCVVEKMGRSPNGFYNSSEEDLDLVRFLIPRTFIRLDTMLNRRFWRGRAIPWDIKEMLITTYATQNLDLSKEYCQQFPMHTVCCFRFESERTILGAIRHYNNNNDTSSRLLDSDGRLPIHLALEPSNKAPEAPAVTPRVILELLKLEPRAACVQDPKTGFFPFEAAAACQITGSCENDMDMEEGCVLNLIYTLFRCDPDRFLKCRGVGQGKCNMATSSFVRESKRQKMTLL